MKQQTLPKAIKLVLAGSLALASSAAFAADKELLDMLKSNGAITQAQYDKLVAKPDQTAQLKKMAWAGKIKVKGDLRLRQETVSGFSDKDRQRVRARIGVYADIADNVQAGIRIATGSDSATGANVDLDNDFKKKDLDLDLAYISWQPVEGLSLVGGKFKKPWEEVSGGLIWDGDLNPEGGALRYTAKAGGAEWIASAGHLIQSDASDNDSVSGDAKVIFAQLATKFKVAGASTKLGVSIFDFDGEDGSSAVAASYQDTSQFKLTEFFAETNVDLGLPVKFYGQYVVNNDANGVNSSEDTAWLLGAATKIGNWKASYDYRETELNAVNGLFNDSDMGGGYTASEGSRWKLAYKINKNFSVATTYIDSEVTSNNTAVQGDLDKWHIDLNAKF